PLLVSQPRDLGAAAEPYDPRSGKRQRAGCELMVHLDGVRAAALEFVPHDHVVPGAKPDAAAVAHPLRSTSIAVVRRHRPRIRGETAPLDGDAVAVGPGHLAEVQRLIALVDPRRTVRRRLAKVR